MSLTPQQFTEAYAKLPRPIREFVAEGGLATAVEDLTKTYQLHVDNSGGLSQVLTETLLGFINPKDLPGELATRIALPPETVGPFVNDLNQKVFMPLQQRVRAMTEDELQEDEARIEPDPPEPVAVPQPEPMPIMQINMAPAPAAPWPVQPPPPIYAAPQALPMYQQAAPAPIYSNPAPGTQLYAPHARTMATDMQLASQGIQGQAVSPARSFQTASVPITYAQQQPAHAYAAPQPTAPAPETPAQQSYPPPAMASVRLTPVDRASDGSPITKEYGNDPYREPIQ